MSDAVASPSWRLVRTSRSSRLERRRRAPLLYATADVDYGTESKQARRLPRQIWPVIRRKLDAVHRAKTLDDLRLPAGNRFEPLQGHRKGEHSIRVNDHYRITFRFEKDGHAYDVACEEYH